MCEQDDFKEMVQYQRRGPTLSRRQFGALSVGAGLVSMVPAGGLCRRDHG